MTITESGAVVYYSLRRNRLDDASAELKRFLGGLTANTPIQHAPTRARAQVR